MMYSFQGYHFQGFNHVPLFHDVPVSLRLVPLLAISHQRCKFIPGQAPEVHCPIYLFFSFYPVHSSCSFDSNQTASTSCIPPLCPDSGLSRAWRRNVFHLMQGCRMQSCNCKSLTQTHQQHLRGHLRILSTGVTAVFFMHSRMTTALKNCEY